MLVMPMSDIAKFVQSQSLLNQVGKAPKSDEIDEVQEPTQEDLEAEINYGVNEFNTEITPESLNDYVEDSIVIEIAKELGIENEEMFELAQEIGLTIFEAANNIAPLRAYIILEEITDQNLNDQLIQELNQAATSNNIQSLQSILEENDVELPSQISLEDMMSIAKNLKSLDEISENSTQSRLN